MSLKKIVFPEALAPGDKIAIVSPASVVKKEYVSGAMFRLQEIGYNPVIMPHAVDCSDGNFAGTRSQRLEDLKKSLIDKEIKAILCARGGYGCCQLLDSVPVSLVANNPKWLIGFSDISALHALWLRAGVASIHGPMAKHLALLPIADPSSQCLFEILSNGGFMEYDFPGNPFNRTGKSEGVLRGGNLAVLDDLSSTPFDMLSIRKGEKVILFLEDINEPIYKVNRILWRLRLSGTLKRIKGLIFGQFSDYQPDKNYDTMEQMIKEFISSSIVPNDCPVVFGFPSGHTDSNFPLVEGANVELNVTPSEVSLHSIL